MNFCEKLEIQAEIKEQKLEARNYMNLIHIAACINVLYIMALCSCCSAASVFLYVCLAFLIDNLI